MFDISDNNKIKNIIECIDSDSGSKVFPLYVRIGDDTFTLLELDNIKQYYPSLFKVGFGMLYNEYDKRSIKVSDTYLFNIIKTFDMFDIDRNIVTKYFIVETSESDINNNIVKDMNEYITMLREKCESVYYAYRKRLVESLLSNNDDWNN